MKTNGWKVWLLGGLVVLGMAPASVVRGQVNSWTNTSASTLKWETPGNWSAGAPAFGHSAFVTNAINAPAGSRFRVVSVDATTAGSGTMTVSNLTVAGIGGFVDAHSTVFLNNAGGVTPLTIRDSLTISANSTVIITNSALVVTRNLFINEGLFMDTGTITEFFPCSGFCFPDSANTFIGNSGPAIVRITSGRWAAGAVQVGSTLPTAGTLTISGGSITMTATIAGLLNSLNVINGAVWLVNGDLATPSNPQIGGAGVGQMTISNGTWTASTTASIGQGGGVGTLTIAGGFVSPNQVVLGVGANSAGTIWQTGGQSIFTELTLGYDSVGQMTLSNGTVLAGIANVAFNPGSSGTLTVAGGDFNVDGWMYVAQADCTLTGVVNITGGSLNVTNSAHTAFLEVDGGTLNISGGTLRADKLVLTNCAHFVRSGGTLIISNLVLDANSDADGDGISNGYEQSHGLDPLNPADGNLDRDGDGMSNLQEFLAGTDATNNASALRITAIARIANTNILVTWTMGPGKTNALQRTAGAANGSYQTNTFATIFTVTNTVGSVTNYLDIGATTNFPARYYRVRLVP